MATFPHNLCGIRQDGHAEQHTPVVLRSEVERGTPRQRRTSADALVSVPCTLVFRSAAAAAAFEAWCYAEGFGWFDFTLPRTGAVVEARIVGGDIGGLTPITPAWNASERSITIEYIRPGFIQLPPGLHSVNPARVLSVQRNSTATYVDDAGVLQTAAANVARYEGGLMLVEGEGTNLLSASEDFSAASWVRTNVVVQANATTSPSGTNTADKVLWDTASTFHEVRAAFSSIAGVQYCGSYHVKAADHRYVQLLGPGVVFAEYANFDIVAGVRTGGTPGFGTITPVGDGWFRISLSLVALSSSTTARVSLGIISSATSARASVAAGDGVSGIYAWGAQLEQASAATSYIPTTTAPATRAADLITVAA